MLEIGGTVQILFMGNFATVSLQFQDPTNQSEMEEIPLQLRMPKF